MFMRFCFFIVCLLASSISDFLLFYNFRMLLPISLSLFKASSTAPAYFYFFSFFGQSTLSINKQKTINRRNKSAKSRLALVGEQAHVITIIIVRSGPWVYDVYYFQNVIGDSVAALAV